LVALLGAAALVSAQTISVRADRWFPVNGDPRAARAGFGIEILDRAWSAAGYQLDYALQPWTRSLNMVKQGAADCVIGAYLTDAPEFHFPDEPLAFDSAALYTLKDHPLDYSGPDSLLDVRLGVIDSYSYGARFDQWLAQRGEDSQVQVVSGGEALDRNIRKLLSGRLDAVVESPLVMQAKLEAMNLTGHIHRRADISEPMPIFVACRPDEDSLAWLQAFDREMRKLRESGAVEQIYQRYGIDPTDQRLLREKWEQRSP
jgi:polar amino acid transport system substrate-binding protein